MKVARPLILALGVVVAGLAGVRHLLPLLLGSLNPGITYRIEGGDRTLYLTLDDGPSEATDQILAVLRKHDVRATFFVMTDQIRNDTMHRLFADGHQIAHHMRTSAGLQRMTGEQFQSEFLAAEQALAPYGPARLFRPPNGSISTTQAEFVRARGYRIVVGTVFPLDHWLERKAAILALTKLLLIDGGIVILHDTGERGPRTAAVLDELLPLLKQKGYRFALLPAPAR